MSDVELLLLGVPLVGLPILVALVAARGRSRTTESWRALARRRGARFHAPGSPWWSSGPGAMEVIVEQAVVLLDTYVVRGGRSSSAYTRARACFAAGGGPASACSARACSEGSASCSAHETWCSATTRPSTSASW
ncbi:MAG: hypothetical protein M5U28_42190 [Sandaracinaceae bacterium]|nr:hypothetical protein [Sandaracinaceae bacterium]